MELESSPSAVLSVEDPFAAAVRTGCLCLLFGGEGILKASFLEKECSTLDLEIAPVRNLISNCYQPTGVRAETVNFCFLFCFPFFRNHKNFYSN